MHRIERGDDLRFVIAFEDFGVDPLDVDLHPVGKPAVDQCFVEAFIGVRQPDIFTHHRDGNFAFWVEIAVVDIVPRRQIRFGRVGNAEGAQHLAVEPFGVILLRNRID